MWDRRARVISPEDGDTLRITLDQGFGDTKTLNLRLRNTWAPEHNEPGGPETTAFVREWLARNTPEGEVWPFVVTMARVHSGDHEVQTFGRYVGTLANAAGEALNDAVNAFVKNNGYGQGIGAPKAAPYNDQTST